MKTHPIRPLSIAVAFAAALSTSHAAFNYTETFSVDNDAAGWFVFTDASVASIAQNPVTDRLDFSATGYGLFFLGADDNTSLGAFTGDYASFPIHAVSFDLSLGVGSTVSDLFVQLTNFTEDETWQSTLTPNAPGTTATFTLPTDSSGTGWTQISGDQSFAFLLDDVEDFSLLFVGSGNLAGSLDNVSAIPEPSTALFGGLAALGLLRRRRTARA